MLTRIPAAMLAGLTGIALVAGVQAQTAKPAPTRIDDRAAFERLIGNSGMSVQWISFEGADRGTLQADYRGKVLRLKGEQRRGEAMVAMDGMVTRVSGTEFVFDGTIRIENTPDAGRQCKKTGLSRFAITQNRKYWRLREFEWCDDLTDYVDVYF